MLWSNERNNWYRYELKHISLTSYAITGSQSYTHAHTHTHKSYLLWRGINEKCCYYISNHGNEYIITLLNVSLLSRGINTAYVMNWQCGVHESIVFLVKWYTFMKEHCILSHFKYASLKFDQDKFVNDIHFTHFVIWNKLCMKYLVNTVYHSNERRQIQICLRFSQSFPGDWRLQ